MKIWRQLLCIFLAALLSVLVLHIQPGYFNHAVAQEAPIDVEENVDTGFVEGSLPTTIGEHGEKLPDWARITFGVLPAITEGGSISLSDLTNVAGDVVNILGYDPSRTWQAGDRIEQILKLGDLQDSTPIREWSLGQIAELAGLDLETVKLADFALTGRLTIADVVSVIPGLEDLPLQEVTPFLDLVQEASGGRISRTTAQSTIASVIRDPRIANLVLGNIDLGQYGVLSIPGLVESPLGEFRNYSETSVQDVPGLRNVPFSTVFDIVTNGVIAKYDVTYGPKEANRTNTITGSYLRGFAVPCNKDSCAYIELADPIFPSRGPLHGKQWISGSSQKVAGGWGCLSGTPEFTGCHPFGQSFKVAITNTTESQGSAQFSLFFPLKIWCGGAYVIGPVPFLTFHEKDLIVTGLNGGSPGGSSSPQFPGGGFPGGGGQPGGWSSPGGPGGAQPLITEGCMEQLLRAVPSSMRSHARLSIPLILDEARRLGINDSRHIAYILATMQRESSFGADMVNEDPGVTISGGSRYIPRGYVQIVHDYNYLYWARRLGIDLMNHPEQAANPGIAAKIIVGGMRDGTFTGVDRNGNLIPGGGHKLRDYINSRRTDFRQARRIVNSLDRAGEIATNAERYWRILRNCLLVGGGSGGTPGQCNQSNRFIWPARGVLTSGYGPRRHPITGRVRLHAGIDIAAPIGTPIIAAGCGTVTKASNGDNGGYGNMIEITHSNGTFTRYAHINHRGIRVRQGQAVTSGQHIADMGSTGSSTGSHLHFEVHPNGGAAVNPISFLPRR